MKCPACSFDNPAQMKFCGGCGSPLPPSCPSCGAENPLEHNFCGQCGNALEEQPAATRRTAVPPDSDLREPIAEPRAERRQLTVMFCDLVGSTGLSEELDPEDLREVIREYQSVSDDVIRRYEGRIAQYLGDGLLTYFGYPVAHEDDVSRAVHAALGILDSMPGLNERFADWNIELAVRIGIHTGPVVAGEIGSERRREQLALGQTPNIAARLQGLAEPNTVLLSGKSHGLIHGRFTCRSRGRQRLKGISEPIAVYQALEQSDFGSRFELLAMQGLSTLAGRQRELACLLDGFEEATASRGQVVLISAGAGLGKSRLVHDLKQRIAEKPHLWLSVQCSAYHRSSALHPLIELLAELFKLRPERSTTGLWRMEQVLKRYDLSAGVLVPLLADLLSIPRGETYEAPRHTPQRQKELVFEGLLTLLSRMASRRCVIFVVEDLQWADPSTLELLDLLLTRADRGRLYVLLTCRKTFEPPWTAARHYTRLELDHLDDRQVESIVASVSGDKDLPPEILRQIVAKAGGVPLFAEELARTVLESGLLVERGDHLELRGPVHSLAIPASLHDSLTARLDQLGSSKKVLLLGAVLGQDFSYELLRAVAPIGEEILKQELARLVAAELLLARGAPPAASYGFRHQMIREAAYESMLSRTRHQYHGWVGKVLVARYADIAETQPELIAYHLTKAGDVEEAIGYWLRAGSRSAARSANLEAIRHFSEGLALVEQQPPGIERDRLELGFLTAIGPVRLAIDGYAAPEVEQIYARAHRLSQRLGETAELFWPVTGLLAYYVVRGQLDRALRLAEQVVQAAQASGDPCLVLDSRVGLASIRLFLGELAEARRLLEECIELYSPERDHALVALKGLDSGVIARCLAALALWLQGHPTRSLEHSRDGIALARELDHPFSVAYALMMSAYLHLYRQDWPKARQRAREGIAISEEYGFAFAVECRLLAVCAEAAENGTGKPTPGAEPAAAEGELESLERSWASYRATGLKVWTTALSAQIAAVFAQHGLLDKAEGLLDEALATCAGGGERFWEAELLRLRGELAALRGQTAEAAEHYRQAIETARRQGAGSLEQRAAASLDAGA